MNDIEKAVSAVYRKDYEYLSSFLAPGRGADVDRDGATLLMTAIMAGNADLEMAAFLIDHGVPVSVADAGKQRWTALHFAARIKRADFVELLLKHGAEVDSIDVHGNTPLSRSLNSRPWDPQTITLLLKAGADPAKKNRHGSSPLDLARLMEDRELEALLLSEVQKGKRGHSTNGT